MKPWYVPVDAGQRDLPEPEDEAILHAVDRGRRNETLTQMVETDDHKDTVIY